MSWYRANTPHDRIPRGATVWLEDTPDVELRVLKGHLEHADAPDWFLALPEDTTDDQVSRQRDS